MRKLTEKEADVFLNKICYDYVTTSDEEATRIATKYNWKEAGLIEQSALEKARDIKCKGVVKPDTFYSMSHCYEQAIKELQDKE